MAIRFLEARGTEEGFCFSVWLDDSKVGADGQPDPGFVREYEWGKRGPAGVSAEDYRTAVLAEAPLLAAADRAALAADEAGAAAGTALALEGQVLP